MLHAVVRQHLATFLCTAAAHHDGGLPAFVEQEFRDFLSCGVWARGFARFQCDTCHAERLVPFSCKRIGVARYRVTIDEPFMPDADPDEDKAIYNTVLRINQWLEARIREAPDQWFWMHNRWPKDAWAKAGVM